MVKKTKTQIEKYVRDHKKDFAGVFERSGKEFIFFQGEGGRFTGYIQKDKDSIKATQRYNSFQAKVKVKFKGVRGKKTLTYNIYNEKQRDNLLFRMNENLRNKPSSKRKQRERDLPDTNFREDAVPTSKEKRKIDLLFDKIEFEEVEIKEFKGGSP